MAQVYDANLVTKSMLNGSRRGEPRKQQPEYLRDLTVGEAWYARQNRNIFNGEHSNPAGYSKWLMNKYPKSRDFRQGCQWDADATIGTDVAQRYVSQYRDARKRLIADPNAHLTNVMSLPELRSVSDYQAGRWRPDFKESKKPRPESPNHHVSSRHAYLNKTLRELPVFGDEYAEPDRAGIEPTTQMTPATGWVPPMQGKDYVNMTPNMNEIASRRCDPTIPNTGVLMKEEYWG